MKKLKKRYLFIIPVLLIFIGIIGIFLHKEQPLEGTFYLVVSDSASRTKTISNNFVIEVDNQIAIIKDNGKIEQQKIKKEDKTICIFDKQYFYNYNTGHLTLTRKMSNSEFENIEFVSDASPIFESYKKGKVRY